METTIYPTNTKRITRKYYVHKFNNIDEMKNNNPWETQTAKSHSRKTDILNNPINTKETEFLFQNLPTTTKKFQTQLTSMENSSKYLRNKYWFNTNLSRL